MVKESRGQLILVTAVLVALTVLASVVLLNAIHIPADLRTGSLSEDMDRVQQIDASVRDDLDRIFVTVTEPGESNITGHRLPSVKNESAFLSAVNHSMGIRRNWTANQSGGLLSVEYDRSATRNGTAIYQTDGGNFTVRSGNSTNATWVALKDASRLNMRMQITNHTGAGNMTLNLSNGADRWTLSVSETAVYTSTGGQVCGPGEMPNFNDGSLRVSVTRGEGTVWIQTPDGISRCGEFTFGADVSSATVRFEHGSRTCGNYGIAGQANLHNESTRDQPAMDDDVIVNPAFNVTFVTDGITYESTYALYNRTRR